MTSIQAIIFDVDDTLYPERDYVFSGYRAVGAAFADRLDVNADELAARMRALFDTPDRRRVFNAIVADAGVAPADADALVQEMVATYRGHMPEIALDPEARELLLDLHDRVALGAISDGYLDVQQRKVDALELAELLDEIVLTDTWGREFWKPHARAFEEIAARLCVAHDRCVYVGDNLAKDFVAPNQLGWQTVLLNRPDRVHGANEAPDNGAPQHTITLLAQLTKLFAL